MRMLYGDDIFFGGVQFARKVLGNSIFENVDDGEILVVVGNTDRHL